METVKKYQQLQKLGNRQAQRTGGTKEFAGSETVGCDTIVVDSCHYTYICQNPQNVQRQE